MYGRQRYESAMRALAMSRVGDMIRVQREKRGMTLRGLARAIDVSAPMMSDVEHGRRTTKRLSEIERVLKLKPGMLWEAAGLCRHCGGTGLAARTPDAGRGSK